MPTTWLGRNVFDESLDRLIDLYSQGHRVVVSFSGGKDSTIGLELAILAAEATGRLPVEVAMQDEEIQFPGTFEYCERVAARPEVSFNWFIAQQAMVNVFNRESPYFWCFDPLLTPEQWVRQPPEFATWIRDTHIEAITSPERFPPAEGKTLFVVIGLRAQESSNRRAAVHSSKGWLTKPDKRGVRKARPIYDWSDADVWKAIRDYRWDYNSAYDILFKAGVRPTNMRIAPPTMSFNSAENLQIAARAWPRWFDRVCDRLPGVRRVVLFGTRAVRPERRAGEEWSETFQRECIDLAPEWIAKRAAHVRDNRLERHARHSSAPFPQRVRCSQCDKGLDNWRKLTLYMYSGDPFCQRASSILPYMEPEFFRQGAGTWEGSPTW